MLAMQGVGMVTALGHDAVSSSAAARAGLQRIEMVDDLLVNDTDGTETAPVAVHRVRHVSAGFFGFGRFLQLGDYALRDLLSSNELGPHDRLGMIVVAGNDSYRAALLHRAQHDPEVAGGRDLNALAASLKALKGKVSAELLDRLCSSAGLDAHIAVRRTICSSTTGFFLALQQAEQWLSDGKCNRCIVGAIDSLTDPNTLEALNLLRLLKTPERPAGMIPGEAACFLMIGSDSSPSSVPTMLATLESPTTAEAVLHPLIDASGDVGSGRVGASIEQCLDRLSDRGSATGVHVCNLNGDPHRAATWGNVLRRLRQAGMKDTPSWYPPAAFGELGAATVPVSLATVARGWARGWPRARNAIIWTYDDFGAEGAVYARPPKGAGS